MMISPLMKDKAKQSELIARCEQAEIEKQKKEVPHYSEEEKDSCTAFALGAVLLERGSRAGVFVEFEGQIKKLSLKDVYTSDEGDIIISPDF